MRGGAGKGRAAPDMSRDVILTETAIVLPDRIVSGTVVLRGGLIAAVQPERSHLPSAEALEGDFLLPGIVDLHTDNLERQVQPRANARWPSRSALVAHDAQCAVAGVTTVLDALCLGDLGFDSSRSRTFREGVADLDALGPALKAEHFLHLRCEQPSPTVLDMLDPVADHPRVRLMSLMDHTPGIGQHADLDAYIRLKLSEGFSRAAIDIRVAELLDQRARLRAPNRRAMLDRVAGRAIALASHDDETEAEVAENEADGITISEFPVTMAAALAARRAGLTVIAGAPNIVRGGSHSGNVRAADLVAAGAVDAFASDYVPASLLEAAFLTAASGAATLPEAIGFVTDAPARMAGLHDRGRIVPGTRADLLRVRVHEGLPFVREVWREGVRIA